MPVENFSNADESKPLSMPRLEYFYMTTCPHCEEFSPIWDKVVETLKSEQIKITTMKHNINDKGAGEKRAEFFKIQSAPTILYVYGPGKDNKYEYSTPRTAEAIVAYVKSKLGTAAASS
jgi:thiol-disulfide isomerase/thioredoxin